ncbi:unnamed protein product [Protopolystoma xenopodis]|uniref:Uncharacterized protein n=1 Tax=Protopolystoma xenopodis TaxID=117903 RepID=A0A448WFT1_9PLAT|nr:unnamed protein product [Protopolystoma xenopodis]
MVGIWRAETDGPGEPFGSVGVGSPELAGSSRSGREALSSLESVRLSGVLPGSSDQSTSNGQAVGGALLVPGVPAAPGAEEISSRRLNLCFKYAWAPHLHRWRLPHHFFSGPEVGEDGEKSPISSRQVLASKLANCKLPKGLAYAEWASTPYSVYGPTSSRRDNLFQVSTTQLHFGDPLHRLHQCSKCSAF